MNNTNPRNCLANIKIGDKVIHKKAGGRIRGRVVKILVEIDVEGLDRMNPMTYDINNLYIEDNVCVKSTITGTCICHDGTFNFNSKSCSNVK